MRRKFQVVVIGDSREIEVNNKLAFETGTVIARNGWIVITGGRAGVMQAASRGAAEADGTVVSILPDWNFAVGNSYADVVLPTDIGYARNSMNVLSGDVVVAIGGGAGTLSEMAFAWTYKKPILAFTEAIGWSARLAGEAVDNTRTDKIFAVSSIQSLERELKRIFTFQRN